MVELEAHRNVLSLRVPALYELILTTTATKDDEDSNIVLPTMDPTLFVILLDYIYTNKFPSQKIQGESLANSIFTVANQFGSNLLIPYNAARWLLFVDLHLCALLKEACVVKEASKENWRQLIDFTAGFAIHDFAKLPQKMDEWITTTTTVEVKGHPFKLRIYPHGNQQSKTDAEYVSIYLIYAGENTETNPVNVRYQIRTKTTTCLPFESKFSSKTPSWGSAKFKKCEDMIRDDLDTLGTLTIEVDITIGKVGCTTGGAGTPTVARSSQRNEGGRSASVVVPNAVLPSFSVQKPPPGQAEGAGPPPTISSSSTTTASTSTTGAKRLSK